MSAERCGACGHYNESFVSSPLNGSGARLTVYCTRCGQETDLGPAPARKPARQECDARAVRVPPPKKKARR